MRLSLFFRDVLTGLLQPVADELQQMIGSINAWSNVEHNENGRHGAVTATDLVVSRLRFPVGQSAQRGHAVIVDDKAYGRPSLDFGDATNSTTGSGYGSGFGYDNLPKGRIWVDSTSTSNGSTMYLGTTNAAPSGITNAGFRITPSGGSVHQNGTNTTTAYQFNQADGTMILDVDATNARVGIGVLPGYPFHVKMSNASDYIANLTNSHATTPFGLTIVYSVAIPNGTSNNFLVCTDNAAQRFVARSNGGLANYQANNVDLSDARVKNIFGPAEAERERFRRLAFMRADYKDGSWTEPDVMLTAQDVQNIYPSLVVPFDEVKGWLGIRTHGIAMRAYKVIQELDQQLLDHERRLATLEARR